MTGADDALVAHHFKFSTVWRGNQRLCGICSLPYDEGNHIEITTLKPYTSYVCPSGGGYGHSGRYTGSHDHPELRTVRDHLCACGAEFVEEDRERWLLSWEMRSPSSSQWHRVETVASRHASEAQQAGLLALVEAGEPIRDVKRVELVESERAR